VPLPINALASHAIFAGVTRGPIAAIVSLVFVAGGAYLLRSTLPREGRAAKEGLLVRLGAIVIMTFGAVLLVVAVK
jgi:hypothetical protein